MHLRPKMQCSIHDVITLHSSTQLYSHGRIILRTHAHEAFSYLSPDIQNSRARWRICSRGNAYVAPNCIAPYYIHVSKGPLMIKIQTLVICFEWNTCLISTFIWSYVMWCCAHLHQLGWYFRGHFQSLFGSLKFKLFRKFILHNTIFIQSELILISRFQAELLT